MKPLKKRTPIYHGRPLSATPGELEAVRLNLRISGMQIEQDNTRTSILMKQRSMSADCAKSFEMRKSAHRHSLLVRPKTTPPREHKKTAAWSSSSASVVVQKESKLIPITSSVTMDPESTENVVCQEEMEDGGSGDATLDDDSITNYDNLMHSIISSPQSPFCSPISSPSSARSGGRSTVRPVKTWVCIKSGFANGDKTVLFPLTTLDLPETTADNYVQYLKGNEDVIKSVLYSSMNSLKRHQAKNMELTIERTSLKDKMLYFKIAETAVEFACVKSAFKKAGFKRTNKSNFNALWSKQIPQEEYQLLNKYQKINHFPGSQQLGRKDSLYRNVSRMRKRFGTEFNFLPKTWMWPEDKQSLLIEIEKNKRLFEKKERYCENLFIVKPRASSRGRGIHVVSDIDSVQLQNGLIQKYIHNPLLIDGKKFDLRLYVAITSFDPLRIYLFEEGLVRFATEKYSLTKKSIKDDKLAHLTNYSLNKFGENFEENENAEQDNVGSKWSLSALRRYFKANNIDDTDLWIQIHDVLVKTVLSVELQISTLVAANVKHENVCFEIFGVDVMIDQNMKPWLIEVNTSPSLSSSSPLDKRVKSHLLSNLLGLVGFVPFSRVKHKEKVEEEKRQRFLFRQSPHANRNRRSINGLRALTEVNFSDNLTEQDWRVIQYLEDEDRRSGSFTRIFPTATTLDRYERFMEMPKYNNILVGKWLQVKNRVKTKQ